MHAESKSAPDSAAPIRARRDVLLGGLGIGALAFLGGGLGGCAGGAARGQYRSSLDGSIVVSEGTRTPYRPPLPTAPTIRPAPVQPAPPVNSASVPILPRTAWTRSGIARPAEAYPMNGVTRITVHHSAMDSSAMRTQWEAARMIENIRASHVRNGWADIGYHYIVDPSGRVWAGRPANKQGAHVKDQNEHNLGIVLLGNYDHQRPSADALNSLKTLVAMQMRQHRVPLRNVYTHQELKPTQCPGRNLQGQMLAMRSRNGALVLATGERPTFS